MYSSDDYYTLSNGLIVTQTSMEILNPEVYKHIKSADVSVPTFLRIFAANLLADTP